MSHTICHMSQIFNFIIIIIFLYFSSDKLVKLIGGGSVINAAYPVELSHDCIMTVSWLSHDCLMNFSWLSHDILKTSSWLSQDFPMTFSCLSHDSVLCLGISGYPRTGPLGKNIKNRTRNRQKIHASTRTGPGTAEISKTVLEPDPEPPDDLSQFRKLCEIISLVIQTIYKFRKIWSN